MSDVVSRERWVSVQDAASLLDKSDRTIRRWEEEGRIPSKREGRRVWVDIGELLPPESDVVTLRRQVDMLRQEVTMLRSLVERQDGEIQFLRQAHAAALRLRQVQLEEPGKRSWWQVWKSED